MRLWHLVARAAAPHEPFQRPEVCARAWRLLRRGFPDALGAVLMPNHLHLIAQGGDRAALLRRLRTVVGKVGGRWERVPDPQAIPDREHLRRQLRYVALNPCRGKLVADPLEWGWSTYRGTLGAVADPWVSAIRLAAALGVRCGPFAAGFHSYVSSDPSVAPGGTRLPIPVRTSDLPSIPLSEVIGAAVSATESQPDALRRKTITRRLFIALAWDQGWRQSLVLSRVVGIGRRAIVVAHSRCEPELLAAGRLCLGDRRLRAGHFAERSDPMILRP